MGLFASEANGGGCRRNARSEDNSLARRSLIVDIAFDELVLDM